MRLIDYAVGTAIAAAAIGVAHAQAVSNSYDINNFNASTYVISRISGSTAVDNSIINAMAGVNGGICATEQSGGQTISTLSVYYVYGNSGSPNSSSTSAKFSNRVLTCESNGVSGVPSGTPIAVFKESTVGSANGVEPLEFAAQGQNSTLNFINAAQMKADGNEGNCAQNDLHPAASLGSTEEVYPYNEYYACPSDSVPTTGTDIPTGGVADVEATLLNDPSTNNPIPTSGLGYLSSNPGYDTVWGVPLTKNLYYALQSAEGLTSKCPTVSGNQELDSPTCAPSLTKAQVASLYAGQIYSWTQLGLNNPSGDNNVYVCRRDYGSGTEGSFEAYFLGARCGKSVGGSSIKMQGEFSPYVWANPSTGSILACMEAVENGGKVTAYYSSNTYTFPGGGWAIGISSTEVKQSQISSAGDTMRFVAVDGVLPTLANTINGFWPYFSTDGIYHVSSVAPGVSQSVVPSGYPLDVFNAITGQFGAPAFMELNDSSYQLAQGVAGGDLTPASKGNGGASPLPVSTTQALANPINEWDKFTSGAVDNCDTPVFSPSVSTSATPEGVLLGTGVVNN